MSNVETKGREQSDLFSSPKVHVDEIDNGKMCYTPRHVCAV